MEWIFGIGGVAVERRNLRPLSFNARSSNLASKGPTNTAVPDYNVPLLAHNRMTGGSHNIYTNGHQTSVRIMASTQDDEEWDKSTSEIQSEDSDELFNTRPNRWRGPPQSWRTLTEEDRLTYNAVERLRNQDLSIHLYNAFALRQTPQLLQNNDAVISDEVCPKHAPKRTRTVRQADKSR